MALSRARRWPLAGQAPYSEAARLFMRGTNHVHNNNSMTIDRHLNYSLYCRSTVDRRAPPPGDSHAPAPPCTVSADRQTQGRSIKLWHYTPPPLPPPVAARIPPTCRAVCTQVGQLGGVGGRGGGSAQGVGPWRAAHWLMLGKGGRAGSVDWTRVPKSTAAG